MEKITFTQVISYLFLALLVSCKPSVSPPTTNPVNLVIKTIDPSSGVAGAKITINGSGFSPTPAKDSVFFNGELASIVSADTSRIVVTVPKMASTGNIVIKVNGASVTGPVFTVLSAPLIRSLSPDSGAIQAKVIIAGSGFNPVAANDSVFFNGIVASVVNADTNQLTVTVPKGATTGSVTVKVNGFVVAGPVFTVLPTILISSISPASGIAGSLDTINGSGFSVTATLDNVYYNGKQATIVSAKASQLVVKVPDQAGTGLVSITISGQSVNGPRFTYINSYSYAVSTFAGTGSPGAADGQYSASFNQPANLVVDASNNVYVEDWGNNKIRKITPDGVVSTFAGSGNQGANDGAGSVASFYHTHGLTIDKNGNLYVADWGNHKVRKITPGGVVSTLAGSGIEGTANGTGTAASFSYPYGIAVDGSNNVYVGSYPNQIRKITPDGVVTTFAGSGNQGAADGTVLSASFNGIHGLCFDGGGNMYVADYTNNEIRKITPGGVVSTFAGNILQGSDDGQGTAARFYNPEAITADKDGNLFVTDWDNETIRKITPAGVVTTIAGIVGYRGGNDGPGASASFYSPSGIAVDSNGNIFVGDPGNYRVRKLTLKIN